MLVISTLLYLATSHLPIQASPILSSESTFHTSIDIRNLHSSSVLETASCSCPQLRSTWDILWSCLATIFACTWVSIHPNSPGKDDGQRRVLLRRVELMIWSILIPEMIIFWALRQWLGARHLARYYEAFGWTTTHGHFLQMGGFMLTDGDRDIEVLTHDRFRNLLKEGTIRFPQISKDEVNSLGKGDGLSKTVVVGQTLWFIAQCISRSAQGLVIAEIELVTLAFAFLNGLMYFLWWNKPLDATSIIRVPICSTRIPVLLPLTSSTASFIFPYLSVSIEEMSKSVAHHCNVSNRSPNSNTDVDNQDAAIGTREKYPIPNVMEEPSEGHLLTHTSVRSSGATVDMRVKQDAEKIEIRNETAQIPIPNLQEPEQIYPPNNIRLSRAASVYTIAESIQLSQYAASSKAPAKPPATFGWLKDSLIFIWQRMAEMRGIHDIEPGAQRIPTFYATIKINTARGLLHTLVISCIGVGFGAIHCAGWNFVFQSHTEKVIWRVNSAIIAAFPCIVILYVLMVYRFVKKIWGRKISRGFTYRAVKGGIFVWYVFVRCLPIYLVARMILLVEALVALRNLPEGAFAQVEWTKFLPHI